VNAKGELVYTVRQSIATVSFFFLAVVLSGIAAESFAVAGGVFCVLSFLNQLFEAHCRTIVRAIEALREGKESDVDGHVCKESPLGEDPEKGGKK